MRIQDLIERDQRRDRAEPAAGLGGAHRPRRLRLLTGRVLMVFEGTTNGGS